MFDWEEFKKGKIAVHCDTEEKAIDFITKCYENEIEWGISREGETNYEHYNVNTCYKCEGNLFYAPLHWYKSKNETIIKWEIKEMTNTEKILDIIGLKVGEKFQTNRSNQIYYFNEELELLYGENAYSDRAIQILNGDLKIIKLPIINDNDKEILNFYAKRGYNWFACDKQDSMWAYSEKPEKDYYCFKTKYGKHLRLIEPLSFLKWEDEPFYWECE